MANFAELRSTGDGRGERNDCSVIALALTCDTTYDAAHAALKKLGRRPRGRTRIGLTEKGALELGRKTIHWFGWDHSTPENIQHKALPIGSPLVKAKTMRTAERVLRKHFAGRKFLLFVEGHVAAFDGQSLQDWSKGRLHRIIKIIEVI